MSGVSGPVVVTTDGVMHTNAGPGRPWTCGPCHITLAYDPGRPWEVWIDAKGHNHWAWPVWRDVLADGLLARSRAGYVEVYPHPLDRGKPAGHRVCIAIDDRRKGASVLLTFGWLTVDGFVRATTSRVARGTEILPETYVDTWLRAVLSSPEAER